MTVNQRKMANFIIDFEARKDKAGHLAVYKLPANDGGGSYEVAGINDRYHPAMADKLRTLVQAGKDAEAREVAGDYLLDYTKAATKWTSHPGVEFYLRDTIFNRGPTGALRILQRAVSVEDDGEYGPDTKRATEAMTPERLLERLRWAREDYERNVVGYRANFWKGLVARWDKALTAAKTFTPVPGDPVKDTTPDTVVRPREHWLITLIKMVLSWFTSRPVTEVPGPGPGPISHPADLWMDHAKSFIGFHETGTNRGIERFIHLAKAGQLGDPWCAIFVNAILALAGLAGTASALARSFEHGIEPEDDKYFVRLSGPAYGAVVTMWRGSKAAGTGHVGFYAGHNSAGQAILLGGNQSDSVSYAPADANRITGYWWPASAPLPTVAKVAFSGAAKAGTEV